MSEPAPHGLNLPERDPMIVDLVRRLEELIQPEDVIELDDPWLDALYELQTLFELGAGYGLEWPELEGPELEGPELVGPTEHDALLDRDDLGALPAGGKNGSWRSRVLVAAGVALVLVSLPSAFAAVRATPPHASSPFITAVDPAPAEVTAALRPVLSAASAPAPRTVTISAIGVRSDLVDLALRPDGTLAAPKEFDTAGWYSGGPAPGAPGAAIIAGHVDSYRGPAVFYRLEKLRPGDQVLVGRADGSTVTFTVLRLESYPKDRFPTERVFGGVTAPELRLVTCFGSFDTQRKTYTRNLVVYARMSASTTPKGQSPLRAHNQEALS